MKIVTTKDTDTMDTETIALLEPVSTDGTFHFGLAEKLIREGLVPSLQPMRTEHRGNYFVFKSTTTDMTRFTEDAQTAQYQLSSAMSRYQEIVKLIRIHDELNRRE